MYLFTRSCRLTGGGIRDGLTWASAITDVSRKVMELDIRLFQQVYSPQLGTIVWSAFVDDLSELEASTDKLVTDNHLIDVADQGRQFAPGGFDDHISVVLHGSPDPNRETEYVSSVRAACANGSMTRGVSFGVQLAQKVEQVTGAPSLFMSSVTGVYGGVGWTTAFANVQELEEANQALTSDPDFLEMVDQAGGVYAADTSITTQRIFRRIS